MCCAARISWCSPLSGRRKPSELCRDFRFLGTDDGLYQRKAYICNLSRLNQTRMKRKLLITAIMGCLSSGMLPAQEFRLQPTPQVYETSQDSIVLPPAYSLSAGLPEDSPALLLLGKILPGKTEKTLFRICIGVKGDKAVEKYARRIPANPEGYYLKTGRDGIVIAGADERGAYYGVQTLARLLALPKLPLAEITDYPDVPYRGVVEGFYGTPWSHEARLRMLDFCGRNKMNVYLYGPKDDPYHSTPYWRKPYPEREAARLEELAARAAANGVIFYWAIHPGQDIKWNDEDRRKLLNKFESVYRLGVRGFAVFFDDISGEGTKADRQAELLNYVDEHFVKAKGDVEPLIMCPTEYNRSWANVAGGYLTTLGETLNPDIRIMWTGNRVVAAIDRETMEFVNPLLKRKAFIWWNFPVSDYVRDHLLMGPVYGNGRDMAELMGGFVSNPMEHAEASKIALYGVADYAWNLADYDSIASWRGAVRSLMPLHAAALETFAAHNSDLGENGHGFRREESADVQPALQTLLSGESPTADREAFGRVEDECRKIVQAADCLMASQENPALTTEIEPWLMQFKLVGQYGGAVLRMLCASEVPDGGEFAAAYAHAKALQMLMYKVDTTYNRNSHQPGVKSGSRVLMPSFEALFASAVGRYNGLHGTRLDSRAAYEPYALSTDIPRLASLSVSHKGKIGSVAAAGESFGWQPGGEVVLSMDGLRTLKSLSVDWGMADTAASFRLETTADGQNWESVPLSQAEGKTRSVARVAGRRVLKIRLTNISGREQQVRLRRLAFEEE